MEDFLNALKVWGCSPYRSFILKTNGNLSNSSKNCANNYGNASQESCISLFLKMALISQKTFQPAYLVHYTHKIPELIIAYETMLSKYKKMIKVYKLEVRLISAVIQSSNLNTVFSDKCFHY